jgi:hypothetical protein
MTAPELATLIGAIGGILGIILKMWQDHTKLANKVADAFEKNAVASTKLESAVDANTKTTDQFSKLLISMTKQKK